MTMDPNTRQRGLLDAIGLQKMQQGAQGETGQRFYQRPSFGRFLQALGAGANQLTANPDPNYDRNIMAQRKAQFERKQLADKRQKAMQLAQRYGPKVQGLVAADLDAGLQLIAGLEAKRLAPVKPRLPTVSSDGLTTISYGKDGMPIITVNEDVVAARTEIERAQRNAKGLPSVAYKDEEADFQKIQSLDSINMGLDEIIKDFGFNAQTNTFDGNLKIGPDGFILGSLGSVGVGGEGNEKIAAARQNFERFKTRLINESLRLNKGVQTEGDSQRAAKELGDANTEALAYSAIKELQEINKRARANAVSSIARRRDNLGFDPVPVPQAPQAPKITWRIK